MNYDMVNPLIDHIATRHSTADRPIFAFSSQWLSIGLRDNQLPRWYDDMTPHPATLLLIPLGKPGHWALYAANCATHTVRYVDSGQKLFRSRKPIPTKPPHNYTNLLMAWLPQHHPGDWTITHLPRPPRQPNKFDCAPFTVFAADQLARQLQLDASVRSPNIAAIRAHIAHYLHHYCGWHPDTAPT